MPAMKPRFRTTAIAKTTRPNAPPSRPPAGTMASQQLMPMRAVGAEAGCYAICSWRN